MLIMNCNQPLFSIQNYLSQLFDSFSKYIRFSFFYFSVLLGYKNINIGLRANSSSLMLTQRSNWENWHYYRLQRKFQLFSTFTLLAKNFTSWFPTWKTRWFNFSSWYLEITRQTRGVFKFKCILSTMIYQPSAKDKVKNELFRRIILSSLTCHLLYTGRRPCLMALCCYRWKTHQESCWKLLPK